MADHLTSTSATNLSRMIRERSVSSSEVVEAHLRRIEQINPHLNAVVQVLAGRARRRATAADRATARGQSWGPLHGIPVTAKDTIEIRGVTSTGGTMGRADYLPTDDATVIERLRGAGAIVLGVTNVPELVLAGDTDNLVYGRTNNPYDLSRTPGGSSGGEAAAIAAGLSPLGLGSDVGGSIRLPAHFCGIAGLKPTTGRVPSTGHWPPFAGLLGPMFQIGPMARYVEDLGLALRLISGTDGRDPYTVPMPTGFQGGTAVDALRVAYFRDSGGARPDADTCRTIDLAVEALREAGVSVTEARPPGFADGHAIEEAVIRADGGATVRRFLEEAGTTETHPLIRWLEDIDRDFRSPGPRTGRPSGQKGPVPQPLHIVHGALRRHPLPHMGNPGPTPRHGVRRLASHQLHTPLQPERLTCRRSSRRYILRRPAHRRPGRGRALEGRSNPDNCRPHRRRSGGMATTVLVVSFRSSLPVGRFPYCSGIGTPDALPALTLWTDLGGDTLRLSTRWAGDLPENKGREIQLEPPPPGKI